MNKLLFYFIHTMYKAILLHFSFKKSTGRRLNEDVNPSREAHSEKLPLNTQLERNPGPLTGAELRWRGVEMTAPLSR